MPKISFYEKDANKDDATMFKCRCGSSSWFIFVFKDGLEFHCKECDEVVVPVDNLATFCKSEFHPEM